jgi:sulfur carrier protein
MSEASGRSTDCAVTVTLNGETLAVPGGSTLASLVAALVPSPRGVAVALNEEVVPRSRWAEVGLADGDRVEVLAVAQGGCR